MWVRGLKQKRSSDGSYSIASHPMWVRGLKLLIEGAEDADHVVAPHVGAWIETLLMLYETAPPAGRTPCGCVD